MMPSMPRLSTPARSHSSTPSVPRISGVAMRSTATQNGAAASRSSVSANMLSATGCRYCVSIVATSTAISETATITSAM